MKELISVIVPVYQGEKTIGKCIESILSSTYLNMEVVVVNDGSTDNTAQIVEGMREKDSRILLVNNTGKGVSSARNTGLRNAHGEFIGFVDADDAVAENMYETLRNNLLDYCDLVLCGTVHCQNQGEIPLRTLPKLVEYERESPIRALETIIYEKTTMSACTKLFKKSIIQNNHGEVEILFPEDQERYEDFMFVCRYVAKCQKKIRFVPQYFYYYTSTNGSLSNKQLPVEVIAKSLKPLLNLGKSFGGTIENISKVFYTETMVKQWYIERIKKNSSYDKNEYEILKKEIRKYGKQYLYSEKVSFFRKGATWMLLYCEPIAKLAVRIFGRMLIS